MQFLIVLHTQEGRTDYGVTVPCLPGCVSAGDTLARIIREGVDSGRDTRASVWYKRSVHKRLATTEAPA